MGRTRGKRFADKNTIRQQKKIEKETEKMQNNTSNTIEDLYNKKVQANQIEDALDKRKKNKKAKVPQTKEKKKRNFILNLIIVICILAIIVSVYQIVLWFVDNNKSKTMLQDIHQQVTISEEKITILDKSILKKHYDLSKLLSQNEDTVGWVSVPNTNIDYPVVQTSDNDYYLTHSFNKSENSAGWVFADYRSNCDNLGYNTVVYGHNRKDQSMFGSLRNVLEENWYSNEDNLYINFSTLDESHVYKVFSTFVCNDKDVNNYIRMSFSSHSEFDSYVNNLKSHSSHKFDTDTTYVDKILTLYTCYGLNNQRLLVFAVLVD